MMSLLRFLKAQFSSPGFGSSLHILGSTRSTDVSFQIFSPACDLTFHSVENLFLIKKDIIICHAED